MVPYFNSENKPNDELMQLKLREGLISLLAMNKDFYPTLFDFTEPWKIDILDFLNKNYMHDLSMEEIALYTGRSLATFKRDFRKISSLSPQKWIMQKRLDVAYEKIRSGERKYRTCVLVSVLKTGPILLRLSKNNLGLHLPGRYVSLDFAWTTYEFNK